MLEWSSYPRPYAGAMERWSDQKCLRCCALRNITVHFCTDPFHVYLATTRRLLRRFADLPATQVNDYVILRSSLKQWSLATGERCSRRVGRAHIQVYMEEEPRNFLSCSFVPLKCFFFLALKSKIYISLSSQEQTVIVQRGQGESILIF